MTGAEAVRVPVLGAVFFTEAATAHAAGRPIAAPMPRLSIALTSALPDAVRWRADARGLVLLGPGLRYDRLPDAAARAQPLDPAPSITGTVRTLDGRYNPRAFRAAFTGTRIAYVPLYPGPAAARFGEAGGIALSLRHADGSPASWAIATVRCTRNGQVLVFRGQADAEGDLAVSLTGLPPLPLAAASDTLDFSVRAADPPGAGAPSAPTMPDPDALPDRRIRLRDGDPFTASVPLTFTRGRLLTGRDLSIGSVTIEV